MRAAASSDLYRHRTPHPVTTSPTSDIILQSRLDGKSGESDKNDRNRMEGTAAIASGKIRTGMIGSSSFNPQLNPQKLLHCCVHPHGGGSAQRFESHPLRNASGGASPHPD